MTFGRVFVVGIVLLVASSVTLVQAQATSNVTTCQTQYTWMINSKTQTPCLASAYLSAQCNDGQWGVPALGNPGPYTHPSGDTANICRCNTVLYNLIQACSVCQGGNVGGWADWKSNCTAENTTVGRYPLPLPEGVAIPSWAYIDFTTTGDQFIPAVAEQYAVASGVPESMSGPAQTQIQTSLRGSSTAPRTSTGSSAAASATSKPPSASGGSSNIGPIVGGVVGGVVGIALLAIIAFILIRKKRQQSNVAPSEKFTYPGQPGYEPGAPEDGYPVQQPYNAGHYTPVPVPPGGMYDQGHGGYAQGGYVQPFGAPVTPGTPYKPYDPSDPSTFPTTPAPGTGNSPTIHSQRPSDQSHQRPGHYNYAPEL